MKEIALICQRFRKKSFKCILFHFYSLIKFSILFNFKNESSDILDKVLMITQVRVKGIHIPR